MGRKKEEVFDLEKFMQENPDHSKRREMARQRRNWFKRRRNGKPVDVKMKYK